MNKYLPTIVMTVSGAIIIVLLGLRGFLPTAPVSLKYEVIRRTVPSYRCRLCTPHGDLCPPHENLNTFDEPNAGNFQCVVTSQFNDTHINGFETKHLRFREIRKDDIDAIYAYARKPLVAARTTWAPHRSKFETARIVEKWVKAYERYLVAPWGVEEKKTGKLIGTAGFPAYYPTEPRVFFSYCLSDEAWGNEYEVEIVRALIEIGSAQKLMNCLRVEAVAREDDPFTQRVLEQAGMNYEGDEPDYKRVDREFISMKHYAILRKDITKQLSKSILS